MPTASATAGSSSTTAPAEACNGSLVESREALPERELGSLCSSLQVAAAAANNDLREYLLAHASQRTSIVPLSRELFEMQTAAKLLIRRCRVVGVGADESSNDQTLPAPVLDQLVTVVHQAGSLVADVMNLLESSTDGSVSRGQEALSAEQITTRLGNVTITANTCTAALNLGLDAMALGTALQPAQDGTDTTQLPAYQTTQLLEDTLSLRLRISNLSSDEQTESPAVLPAISEFLDRLQNQMGQGSNSLLVPTIAESRAESSHSRSDSASLLLDLPQNSGGLLHPNASEAALSDQQQSPAYDSVRVEHPAPASITLQHVSRKPPFEGEILSVAFVTKKDETHVTANTMLAPTRFYPLAGQNQTSVSQAGGLTVFPPEGAHLTTWAYVVEDEVGSSHAGPSPWLHDGTDFRKPVLCVGDFASGKRVQKLRQWEIRPLCFSRDGGRLAVTTGRHRVALLDAAHQFAMRTDEGLLTAHADEVTLATFTPDSHALVTASRDGTVRLTDPLSMEPLGKLDTGAWKRPALLGVTPDSNVVVSVWGADLVYRWNHTTGAVDSFAIGARRVREGWPVALSPDCRFLVCRNDQGADISDAHSGKVLFTVHFNKGFLTAAAFTKDSRYVALAKASTCVGTKVHQSTLDIWEIVY
ncbi:hypothetical protein PWT90_10260 [Aphanocladium album]|nr:hypothetical protein PWT90_10260 [Aphanocladium album]